MWYLTVRTWLVISMAFAQSKQRFTALFLSALILFGIAYPPAAVFAAAHSTVPTAADIFAKTLHKTSTTPSICNINYYDPPSSLTKLKSKFFAATDANKPVEKGSVLLGALANKVNNKPLVNPVNTT